MKRNPTSSPALTKKKLVGYKDKWNVPNKATARNIEYFSFCDISLERKFENGLLVKENRRNILVGADISGFCEVFPIKHNYNNIESRSIEYLSFKNDYNLKNACVSGMNVLTGIDAHSYLIDSKTRPLLSSKGNSSNEMKYEYIVVFECTKGYNVYDIINDTWLLDDNVFGNEDDVEMYEDEGARSLLITDNILLISSHKYLYFYWISVASGHVTNPI